MNWRQSRLFVVITVLAALMLAVACAQPDSDDNDVDDVDDTPVVTVVEHEEYGTILADGDGMTLYVWQADDWETGETTCDADCRVAWPMLTSPTAEPIIAEEVPATVAFGTMPHPDDEDAFYVTLNTSTMPLYTFFQDEAPGDVAGQGATGFGDYWWIVAVDVDEGTAMPVVELEEENDENDNGNPAAANNGATDY